MPDPPTLFPHVFHIKPSSNQGYCGLRNKRHPLLLPNVSSDTEAGPNNGPEIDGVQEEKGIEDDEEEKEEEEL